MFKNIVLCFMLVATLAVSVPADAAFGSSGGRSSLSSSSKSSTSYSAPKSGGISSGGNVGMQRSITPAPTKPTSTSTASTSSASMDSNRTVTVTHVYSQPVYNGGSNGYGMGTVAMAGIGGYMLGGLMHDRSGAIYNGPGYSNGVPIQGGQYDVQQPAPQVVYAGAAQQNGTTFMGFLGGLLVFALLIGVITFFIRRMFL